MCLKNHNFWQIVDNIFQGSTYTQVCTVIPGHMINDRRKASRAVKSDGISGLIVSLQDALGSVAVWVVRLHVQEELVGEVRIGRNPGAESQRRKHSVCVVMLDDLAHGLDGQGVGVVATAWSSVVKRWWVGYLAVGSSEVNSDGELEVFIEWSFIAQSRLNTLFASNWPATDRLICLCGPNTKTGVSNTRHADRIRPVKSVSAIGLN